jgi:hypothetical protein
MVYLNFITAYNLLKKIKAIMDFTPNKEERLIIRLIRGSLINFKLVSGLNVLGLNADDYHLYLGDIIFELMGFNESSDSDLIYEKVFLANCEKVKHISFARSTEELDLLSEEIFKELMFAKEMI